jgi:hypothetical protein
MAMNQFVDVIKPFIADILGQNISNNPKIKKEISIVSKLIPTKKGKDDFLDNVANTIVAELMKYLPEPFSVMLIDEIKTQIDSQGIKFDMAFPLPPINPYIEFKILVNESQIFTEKMKFMINTVVTPIGFEVQPTSEKKFIAYGKLNVVFSLSLIQSVTLGFKYDTPQSLWEKSFEIDFSKYHIEI